MRKTTEFDHYDGCRRRDPANCSACALTDTRQGVPNYSAWPLAYMENERGIPAKWKAAFLAELQSSNKLYAANLRKHVREYGAKFSDGTFAAVDSEGLVSIRGVTP